LRSGQRCPIGEFKKAVTAVGFDRKGELLALGSSDGKVRIVKAQDGSLVSSFSTGGSPSALSFSSDSALAASGSSKGEVAIWETKSGQLIRKLDGHKGKALLVAFEPGSDTLLSIGADKTMREWNFNTGQNTRNMNWPKVTEVSSAACSEDCSIIAIGAVEIKYLGSYSGIREFKYFAILNRQGEEVSRIGVGNENHVDAVAMSCDGSLIASGALRDCVRIYDTTTGGQLA